MSDEVPSGSWNNRFSFSGMILVLSVSSFSHLFGCYSTMVQEIGFGMDYGAISLYGLTTCIAFEHYLCSSRCFGLVNGRLNEFPIG